MAGPSARDCYDKAIELVARRPHFRRELARKLSDRGFSEESIDATLGELARLGLVDDRRQAIDMALGPMQRKGFGPRRMRAELQRRGVDETVAETAIGKVFADPAVELQQALAVAAGWRRSHRGEAGRLARHLDRKGYSKAVILRVLEEQGE